MRPPPFGTWVPGNRWDLATREDSPRRTVSVIVAHYRQAPQLARTLAALARQDYPASLVEVIVADDGSPEPPEVPAGVTLVRQPDRGFRLAAARNLGVAASTGELLCFLDADTAPEPRYLSEITRLPTVLPEAVVTGTRRFADLGDVGPEAPIEHIAPPRALPDASWLVAAHERTENLLLADRTSYRFVIGASIACSRWLFDETGGFDEGFTDYGGEDWEWAYRAWRHAAVLAHAPGAVCWHDGADWSGRDATDRAAEKNRETLHLARALDVGGARPHALLTQAPPETVVRLGPCDAAAAFVTADSVLRALPHALVELPGDLLAALPGDGRLVAAAPPAAVTVDLHAPVHVAPGDASGNGGLAAAVAEVLDERAGSLTLGSLATVTGARSRLREERWGRAAAGPARTVTADGLTPLDASVDVAAYLGGWGPLSGAAG